MDNGGITTATFAELVANLRRNTARKLPQCRPYAAQDRTAILLAGGPSLNSYAAEIRSRADACPVICTNGTYNWCLERGITPRALVVVDARQTNVKFVAAVVPSCKYLFASQVHPDLFDAVPADQTWIWHSDGTPAMNAVIDAAYGGDAWHPVVGGCTVTLRAMSLLRMLGWRRLEVYGMDSCLMWGEHHAYNQEENDAGVEVVVTVGDQQFHCHDWMVRQAEDFEVQKARFKDMRLTIHGHGLIAAMHRCSETVV
jgi:hypothetical protein